MNTKELRLGSILSYIQILLNVIISLIFTPIMIKILGQNEYGLYNTVASTIAILSLLNLGFSSGYVKYFTKYKSESRTEDIYRLNGLFIILFSVIGLIAFICGLFLCMNVNFVFKNGLTVDEKKLAKILMFLLTINLSISFPMSVFSNIIIANERFVFLKILGILKNVLNPIVTIPVLFLGFGSVGMVIVSFVLSVIVDIIYWVYVVFRLKNKFYFTGFEKGIFKSLFVYTSFIAINMIVDQINWNIDKVILGRFWGTAIVAVYSVGATLFSYFQLLSTAISGVFTPKIHMLVKQGNKEFSDLFIKVGRLQFIIISLVTTGFAIWGKEFLLIWVGKGYETSYYIALLLMIPATVPLIQNLGIEIQRAMNKHKFRSAVYIMMAVINLVLSIILCQKWAAIGSVIGTSISLVVANGIIMNFYYAKECELDIKKFWKNILSLSKGLIFPVLIALFIKKIFFHSVFVSLLIQMFIFVLIFTSSMYFIGFNNEEKNFVKKLIFRK